MVKRGHKNKVEYLIKFVGYGPEHNLWQDDVANCEKLVQAYWSGKPESERLVVMLTSQRKQGDCFSTLSSPHAALLSVCSAVGLRRLLCSFSLCISPSTAWTGIAQCAYVQCVMQLLQGCLILHEQWHCLEDSH